jgi:hypothetical protein
MSPILGAISPQAGGQGILSLVAGQPQQPPSQFSPQDALKIFSGQSVPEQPQPQMSPQDALNLFMGRPTNRPQPPAGLSAALQQANPAMSGLFGFFKDGGPV